jgi:hypothetical protein
MCNEKLHNSHSSPTIIRMIKSRKRRWAGQVAQMGENRILVGEPEGKTPLGIPRWVDNIKIDLREIGWGGMDQNNLAQDRDQWRALVNMGMYLQVP